MQKKPVHWLRLILTLIAFLVVSIGLGYALQRLLASFHLEELNVSTWLVYLIISGILFLVNLSVVIPLPFGVSIMLAAADLYNPVLVALFGSLGACLGEFSAYFFGYLGKRVAIREDTYGYQMVKRWVRKYGMWAIAFLSFQPVIPFEIGGLIAGLARMPIRQFLPAIWIGRFPKYLILIYLGTEIFRFFGVG